MVDLFVHVRMKECCRSKLKELDAHKKKAKHKGGVLGVPSLFEAFSEKTIDAAKTALSADEVEPGGQLEALSRAACEKICAKHAEQHGARGETEEAEFWAALTAVIAGKPARNPSLPTSPGAHGKFRGRNYVVYASGVKLGGSRSWRNNNPGNIMAGAFATSHGAIGSDGHFAIFPDEATGSAALVSLIKREDHKRLSIEEVIAMYAPPSENNTKAYLAAVHEATGLDANCQVGTLSDKELGALMEAIRAQEGWRPGEIQ